MFPKPSRAERRRAERLGVEQLERRDVPDGAVAGHLFNDLDGDAQQDTGEDGVGGIAVEFRDVGWNLHGQTTTAADGSYERTGLPAVTGFVLSTIPAVMRFSFGYPANDSHETNEVVTVPEGGTAAASEPVYADPFITVSRVQDAVEGGTPGRFRFTRTEWNGVELTATYLVQTVGPGLATPGSDYAALSGAVLFPAGESTVEVDVTAYEDWTTEQPESVTVMVAEANIWIAGVGTAQVWIMDADRSIAVNLTADNNVDGVFDAADDALEMDDLGKVVFVNDDDDNSDLEVDKDVAGPTESEDDLAAVRIELTMGSGTSLYDGFTLEIEVEGDVGALQLWEHADRTDPLGSFSSYVFGQDEIPTVFFIEGLSIGVVTIKATVRDPVGNVAVQPGGAPAVNVMRARVAEMDLDVDNDLSADGDDDHFWTYRPGYIGNNPVLSSGAFAALTALTAQPMKVIVDDLGSAHGVGEITASLTSFSEHSGYAGNAADPGDGALDNMDDVSFSGTADKHLASTDTDGAVMQTKSYLNLFVRDYGATGNLNVWVKDTAGRTRANHTKKVVRDADGDSLQDGWEATEVQKFIAQYAPPPLTVPTLAFFTGGGSAAGDEYADPDGANNGDGGRNLPGHKAPGDSLTPFQEYRGFILDGGHGGHGGGHKRLSPAYKELLWEVDTMQGITHIPQGGLKAVWEAVAADFADVNRGPGIQVYWVVSENLTPYVVFDTENAPAAVTYARDHRDAKLRGEFIHLIPNRVER